VRPYLLNVAVVESEFDPAPIVSTAFAVLNGFGLVLPRYIWIVLRSPPLVAAVEEQMRGQAYPAINDTEFSLLPFPLPPQAEQHRIVAKVDELMALCDRLEAARAEREAARDRLTAASLAHINTPCPETLADDARFALDALPGLTARPDQIRQLRQAILSLAVRGKLLPQDFTDEPATEFLARIAVEKSKIARESGAKEKPEIARDSGDPFDLPSSWTWCQLDKLAWKITDGDHLTPKRESCGQYLLSARNIHNGRIDLSDVDFVGDAEFKRMRQRCDPDRFDVLISCSGSVGRVAIVDKDNAYVMVRSAALVKPVFADDLAPYLAKALMSDCVQSQMGVRSKAAAQPNLFIGPIRQLLIPLPPLTEQHRIVAKVDELMALCDRLEASLATGEDRRRRLLEVLLQESLQTANAREEAI
jgi:type I restriction enzyme S subunit